MGRAPCCDKSLVKKGPWSPEEDAMLKAYIDAHGTGGNWIALPQKIGLKRCGKSCRLRWLNYLRPNIKHGGFSDEEDNTICSLYISIGSRWSVIAAQLPGRTDNDIKNYWNTKLKKKLIGRRKQALTSSSSSSMRDAVSYETQRLNNSALERLQLHIQLQNSPHNVNGPKLWPKLLHPAQVRMIQNLTTMNNNNNTPYLQNQNSLPKVEIDAKSGNQKFDELVGVRSNQMNSTMHGLELEQLMGTPSSLSSLQLQAEFDDFIKTTHSDRREISQTNGGFWWSNDQTDPKSSASLSSDDSNSVIASGGHMMMFHDYGLGYNA